MCRLFETIRIENKIPEALEYHQERMNRSRWALFGSCAPIELSEVIDPDKIPGNGIIKCRVVFDINLHKVEYLPYQKKIIHKLKVVNAGTIDYHHKYFDRNVFDRLLKANPDADEVMIAVDGLITDTTFTNLAFYNGVNWLTPEKPLLAGVRRRCLIEGKKIIPSRIRIEDVKKFQKISLINAMLDLGDIIVESYNAMG